MSPHTPVMLAEVLGLFRDRADFGAADGKSFFIDATLGGGGHAEAILEEFPGISAACLDRDALARKIAGERLSKYGGRARVIAANFSELGGLAGELREELGGGEGAYGALFDFGVSNMQITTPERGFSFQDDGPLDMRMDAGLGATAADLLREAGAGELVRIFRDYGEERHAFQIARAVVRARERGEAPATTGALVALIRDVLPAPVQRKMGGHPARRVFQALRIAVNSELDAIPKGLAGALAAVREGGVVIAISYHSLEDRIVKRAFREWEREGRGRVITRRPTLPSDEESRENRRARSAKLRAFAAESAACDEKTGFGR
jgi:16S rRNA (cytosine1402-N4)-methyltransferase